MTSGQLQGVAAGRLYCLDSSPSPLPLTPPWVSGYLVTATYAVIDTTVHGHTNDVYAPFRYIAREGLHSVYQN